MKNDTFSGGLPILNFCNTGATKHRFSSEIEVSGGDKSDI